MKSDLKKVEISIGIFQCNDFVFIYIYFIKRWQEVKKIAKISRIHEFREVVPAKLVVH